LQRSMNTMNQEENVDYEFDENVEDYSDDVDYEADEVEHDMIGHNNKKFKSDKSLADDKEDVGVYESLLEAKYSDIKSKYEEAQKEITELKRKKDAAPIVINPDERVKQLEDRVVLIKTKAKERIAEKDAVIEEQNEKLKKFEDILALLEVNCKQAVVKYNDAQVELAKKEEALQLHLSFKNRYDYKLNFLDEKARKMQMDYEIKIRKLEERIAACGDNARPQQQPIPTEVKKDLEEVKVKSKKAKVTDAEDDGGFAFPRKPKTLRIAKVEPAAAAAASMKPELPNKLPLPKGLNIKEVFPSTECTNTVQDRTVEESSEDSFKTNPEPTLSNDFKEECKDDSKQIVTNLPGIKITLTDPVSELDRIDFQEPELE